MGAAFSITSPRRGEVDPRRRRGGCDPAFNADPNPLTPSLSPCGTREENAARSCGGTDTEEIMLARDEEILKAAEGWRRSGRGVALATVMETWGSAPRPVGANLVIDEEGNFLGSVSGGCVEGAVVAEALDVIETGNPKVLEFGVADETAWNVGLSCGGTIRVLVEKVE